MDQISLEATSASLLEAVGPSEVAGPLLLKEDLAVLIVAGLFSFAAAKVLRREVRLTSALVLGSLAAASR